VVERVGPILAPGGVFVLECSSRNPVPASERLAVWKSRRYGETQITLYLERNPEDTP
jgi:16S rRNA G966 N2-methylase RsmD